VAGARPSVLRISASPAPGPVPVSFSDNFPSRTTLGADFRAETLQIEYYGARYPVGAPRVLWVNFSMSSNRLQLVRRIVQGTLLGALALLLPGCQSISPTPTIAEIRYIDASPDAPGMDIYQGSTAQVYNMGFATVTSYVPASQGTYRFAANTSGTSQVLVNTNGTILNGHQYTVMISNVAASLQMTVFSDQSGPAPSGQLAFRIINENTSGGSYDVYLIPSGATLETVSPIFTSVVFNTISNYIDIPDASYAVAILPAGTVPTTTTVATYEGALTTYNAGSAHTFVILNQKVVTTPGAQVQTLDDYESPDAPTI